MVVEGSGGFWIVDGEIGLCPARPGLSTLSPVWDWVRCMNISWMFNSRYHLLVVMGPKRGLAPVPSNS
jgi:hypothetical protein